MRIGVDHVAGAATGAPERWTDQRLGGYPRAIFAGVAQVRHHRRVSVLDVRRDQEYRLEHLEQAVHIPIHEIPERMGEVPAGEVWVRCGSGYGASIVASLLAARGQHVVVIDDVYAEHAGDAGIPLVSG